MEELKYKTLFRSSVLIVVLAFIWLRPLMIGWFDTPANQYFTYEVEDDKGITYQLPKNEMNPYHQWFQYDHFLFLLNKPCIPLSGFGYVYNYKLFNEISNASPETLKTLSDNGTNCFNARKAEAYDSFIKTYFLNRNKLSGHTFLLTKIAAPHHLHGSSAGLLYKNQIPVTKFRVIYNLTFSSSGKTSYISKSILHEVPIPE